MYCVLTRRHYFSVSIPELPHPIPYVWKPSACSQNQNSSKYGSSQLAHNVNIDFCTPSTDREMIFFMLSTVQQFGGWRTWKGICAKKIRKSAFEPSCIEDTASRMTVLHLYGPNTRTMPICVLRFSSSQHKIGTDQICSLKTNKTNEEKENKPRRAKPIKKNKIKKRKEERIKSIEKSSLFKDLQEYV